MVPATIRASASRPKLTAPEEGGESAPRGQDLVPLVEDKKIMQPFGDRSKVVIEPMLTDQWFVDAAKIVGPALDAVRDGRAEIMPESGEKVYFHWLENIEPWCISRQLWWGHRIPVWYGPDRTPRPAGAVCAATEAEALAQMRQFTATTTSAWSRSTEALHPARRDRRQAPDEGAIRQPRRRSRCRSPRPRRARHLVLLRPLADRHARLAREDAGAGAVLPRALS